jgi:hypothetical protein
VGGTILFSTTINTAHRNQIAHQSGDVVENAVLSLRHQTYNRPPSAISSNAISDGRDRERTLSAILPWHSTLAGGRCRILADESLFNQIVFIIYLLSKAILAFQ